MEDDLKKRVTLRRLEIAQQGLLNTGVSPNVDPDSVPNWYDPVAFKHAQKLFENYGIIIRISQLYGLNLVLYHTSGLMPLLATGNSSNISKLFTRYLSTMLHVNNWFEHDPFDKQSKCYRSLKLVRGLHQQVAKKMNQTDKLREGCVDGQDKPLWISQYGMCHAQFSFVGLMAVFPKELGFHNFTADDFHAMFHFWRVIGYCLGTDDRFNLCTGSDEETFELCRQIYFDEWLPVIRKGTEKVGIEMSKGICTAMSRVNPNLNYNVLMRYASSFLQLDRNNYNLENFSERIRYCMMLYLFSVVGRSRFQSWLLTKVSKIRIERAIARKSYHQEYLKKKYANISYTTDKCPFDVKFNYVDVFQME